MNNFLMYIFLSFLYIYFDHFYIYLLFDIAIFIHVMLWQIDLDMWDTSHICMLPYFLSVFALKRKKGLVHSGIESVHR